MKQGITAEQARRGMVFDHLPSGKRVTAIRLYSERPQTIACRPHAWECNPGGVIVEAGPEFALLGCDPAIAARADCEQYGIAPGCDAPAHGFARTREGGAVDLRRSMPVGSVYTYDDEPVKERRVVRTGPAFLPAGCTFVGMRSDQSLPEDVRRLCCGAPRAPAGETFKHITETGKRDVCCTLAIGDHAEHEDIAAGVKWPATMTGTWSAGMAGAPVIRIGAPVNDGSGDMRATSAGPCAGCGGTIVCACKPESAFRFEDDGGRLRPRMGVAFPTTWLDAAPAQFYPDNLAALKEAIAADPGGLVVPKKPNAAGWVYYLPTGAVFVEDAPAPVPAAPKAAPCDAPGSVLAIGAHEFATCSVVPCRGGMRIECHVPLVSVAQKDVGRAILGHLTDGLPIALRASGKTTTGVAVEWTHGPHPQCRDVELFQVTLRPSNEQSAPAPATPKASPTAARDAAVAFCSFIDRLKRMAAIAARDAAVHKAIDSVPDGCDSDRWGNVVRVIAADVFESAGHHGACEYATNKIRAAIADCTPSVQMYAALRFVHRYSAAEATREVVRAGGADGCPATARLLAAYEADR